MSLVPRDWLQVLHQCAAMLDIQDLQAAANGKHRKIAFQRLGDQAQFQFVAEIVRIVRLRAALFAITRGVNVRAAHQHQTGHAVE